MSYETKCAIIAIVAFAAPFVMGGAMAYFIEIRPYRKLKPTQPTAPDAQKGGAE